MSKNHTAKLECISHSDKQMYIQKKPLIQRE